MSATGTIDVQGALTDLDSPEHLHLALAQVLPASSEDEASGYAKLKAYATQAADAGADVVAFPEYFLTGATHEEWYGVRDKGGPEPFQTQDADEGESHWVHDICTLARQLDVNIVAGTVVELGHHVPHRNDQPVSSDSLFNTAYFIGREGEVKGRYTKRNLWHPERKPLTAGQPSTHPSPLLFTFSTRRGRKVKAGMQICWDLAFPESFRELLQPGEQPGRLTGPDVIFAPTCWYATDAGEAGLKWNKSPSGEAQLLDSVTSARALECESVLCMINISGPAWDKEKHDKMSAKDLAEGEPIGVGRTCIKAPFLGTVGLVEGPEEKLLLGSVDLRLLDDARSVYRIRYDLADAT